MEHPVQTRSGRPLTKNVRTGLPKSVLSTTSTPIDSGSLSKSVKKAKLESTAKELAAANASSSTQQKKQIEVARSASKPVKSTSSKAKIIGGMARTFANDPDSSSAESDSESLFEESISNSKLHLQSSSSDASFECRITNETMMLDEDQWDYVLRSQGRAQTKAFILIEKAGNHTEIPVLYKTRRFHNGKNNLFEFASKGNGQHLALEVRNPDDLIDFVQSVSQTFVKPLQAQSPSKAPPQVSTSRFSDISEPPVLGCSRTEQANPSPPPARCVFVGQSQFLDWIELIATGANLTSEAGSEFVKKAKDFKIAREFVLACAMMVRGGHDGKKLIDLANEAFQATFKGYVQSLKRRKP